jgi:hypothetical protein
MENIAMGLRATRRTLAIMPIPIAQTTRLAANVTNSGLSVIRPRKDLGNALVLESNHTLNTVLRQSGDRAGTTANGCKKLSLEHTSDLNHQSIHQVSNVAIFSIFELDNMYIPNTRLSLPGIQENLKKGEVPVHQPFCLFSIISPCLYLCQ